MSGWLGRSIAAKEQELAAAQEQLAAASAARDGSDERLDAWFDACELRDELAADLSEMQAAAQGFEETGGRTRSHTDEFYDEAGDEA